MSKYPGARVIAPQRNAINVWVHLNVVYAHKDGRDLHLQIIQPSGDASLLGEDEAFGHRYPCALFVQGSGWGEQPLGMTIPYLSRFAEAGFVVAVVEYRPASVAPMPAQVADTKTAWRWLQAHADEYSIDPDTMIIAGDSSGGHTALLVQLTAGTPEFDDEPDGDPIVPVAAVAIYPPTDLTKFGHSEFMFDILGGHWIDEEPELARSLSPTHRLDPDRKPAPLLLVHGTADDVVSIDHSTDHFAAARAAGHRVELVVVEEAGHGSWPALFSPQLARLADEFLTEALQDSQQAHS